MVNLKVRSLALYQTLNHQAVSCYDEAWLAKLLRVGVTDDLKKYGRQFLVSLLALNFYIPEWTPALSNNVHLHARLGFSITDNGLIRRGENASKRLVIDNKGSNLYKFLNTIKVALGMKPMPYANLYGFQETLPFPLKGNIPSLQRHLFKDGLSRYPHLSTNPLFILYNRMAPFTLIDPFFHTALHYEYLSVLAFNTLTNIDPPALIPTVFQDITDRNGMSILVNPSFHLEDEWLLSSNHIDITNCNIIDANAENAPASMDYLSWFAHSFMPSATAIYNQIKNAPKSIADELNYNFTQVKRGKYV